MISENSHTDPVHHGIIDLDSHADTIVFCRNFVVIHFTGREYDVSPYTDAYEPIKSVKIACSRTAWMSSASGETNILVFNEGLWVNQSMIHLISHP